MVSLEIIAISSVTMPASIVPEMYTINIYCMSRDAINIKMTFMSTKIKIDERAGGKSRIDRGDSRKPINSQSMTSARVTNNLSECYGSLSRYLCENFD